MRRDHLPHALQIVPLRALEGRDVEKLVHALDTTASNILTSAMPESAAQPFIHAGFQEVDALYLLELTIDPNPNTTKHRLQSLAKNVDSLVIASGRAKHLNDVLTIDEHSFDSLWRLDKYGIREARRATPSNRYTVALENGVVAYAISGAAGNTGYLQRLATHRDTRRRGIGSLLVADGVEWARKRGSRRMLVNTQVTNDGAVNAYKAMGFSLLPDRLRVYEYQQ